jgi:anti-sigma factor RsiW
MDCESARNLIVDSALSPLPTADAARLAEHLGGCPDCRRVAAAEQIIGKQLTQLPRYAAPDALKQQLEARYLRSEAAPPQPRTRPARRLLTTLWPAATAAATLLIAIPQYYERVVIPRREQSGALLREAVGDHLRILASDHPLSVESSNLHQVRPWFAGRVDFAPPVAFAGDDEFPLLGGAVSYVLDRKAATFVFKRRLHTISLLVLPTDGLAWPEGAEITLGRVRAHLESRRGFWVLFWRDAGLGYILTSDLNQRELQQLALKIVGP